jgi:hypothetical protein
MAIDAITDDDVIDEVADAIRRAWVKRSADGALWMPGQRKPTNHWRVMAMAAIAALVPALEARNAARIVEVERRLDRVAEKAWKIRDECDD